MIEDKKKFEFPKLEVRTVKLGGHDVLVEPYLTANDQAVLVDIYLSELFNGDKYAVLDAENALLLSLIETCTNIMGVEGEGDDKRAIINLNMLFENQSFIKEMLASIVNYKEFRTRLDETVSFLQSQKSIENKINLLLAKIINFVDEISDLSPERMDELKKSVSEISDSPILKEAINMFGKKQ